MTKPGRAPCCVVRLCRKMRLSARPWPASLPMCDSAVTRRSASSASAMTALNSVIFASARARLRRPTSSSTPHRLPLSTWPSKTYVDSTNHSDPPHCASRQCRASSVNASATPSMPSVFTFRRAPHHCPLRPSCWRFPQPSPRARRKSCAHRRAATAGPMPPSSWLRRVPALPIFSRLAAHRRSRRWPTVPQAFRRSAKCSARATRG